jgi:hypothetical protein
MQTQASEEEVRSEVIEASPGVFVVDFKTKENVSADRCEHLIKPLIDASKNGPIVLLGIPPPEVRLVPSSMTSYWLDAIARRGVDVSAVGLVTPSVAMRVVLKGLQLALAVTNRNIEVKTLSTKSEAINWAQGIVKPRSTHHSFKR